MNLLDEVLNYIPNISESGFDAIMVCFHDEELENVFLLVDCIIREGINVYTSSRKLFDKFRKENHPLRDFVIFADSSLSVQHLDFCITVLSNGFIYQNFADRPTYTCHLLQYALENEIKTEVISFDTFLTRFKIKNDSRFRSYRSVQRNNLSSTVRQILSNRIKAATFGNISMEEIKQELINTHKNFQVTSIEDNSNYSLLNLKMDHLDDVEFNYMVLTKDFNLNQV